MEPRNPKHRRSGMLCWAQCRGCRLWGYTNYYRRDKGYRSAGGFSLTLPWSRLCLGCFLREHGTSKSEGAWTAFWQQLRAERPDLSEVPA
jgi:hypothetical protein